MKGFSTHRFDAAASALLMALALVFVWASVLGGWLTPGIQDVFREIPAGDKIGHLGLYGAVTFAAVLLARTWIHIVGIAVAVFGIGVLEEFRQAGIPRRAFDTLDIWANGFGVILGVAAGVVVLRAVQPSD